MVQQYTNTVDYLSPRVFAGLLTEIPMIEDLIGLQFFPFQDEPGDRLIFDLIKRHAPMASFRTPGAESPGIDVRPRLQQMMTDVAYVGSKIRLQETDVRWLREYGNEDPITAVGAMAATARRRIANDTAELSRSVDRRIEKMCIDTLLGAISVVPSEDNRSEVSFSVTYPVNTVQAGDAAGANNSKLWSDTSSDPLADLLNWGQNLRYTWARGIIPRRLMNYLARNATLRANIMVTTPAGQPTVLPHSAIVNWFRSEIGIELTVYDSVYTRRTEVLTNGVPVSTDTEYRYLPDNKMIILPAGPIGYFATSPAPQNEWRTGKFVIPNPPEKSGRIDPWIFEVIAGIYGLPVPLYADRIHVVTAAGA